MVKIDDVKLVDLIPENLKTDPMIYNLFSSMDELMNVRTAKIRKLGILTRDDWTDEETDELAYQFHVDYYDPNLPLEQKRQLVKQSISIHRRKGTPSAVEDLVTTIFGFGEVQEWYEYGDDPFYFQVVTDNPKATNEQALQFLAIVNSVKRESAHLRRVLLQETSSFIIYEGVSTHIGTIENSKVVNI